MQEEALFQERLESDRDLYYPIINALAKEFSFFPDHASDRDKKGILWFNPKDDSLMGFCMYNPYPNGTGMNIWKIFVHPNYRNKGLGKRMVSQVEKEQKRGEIMLCPLEESLPFWGKMGYESVRKNKLWGKMLCPLMSE